MPKPTLPPPEVWTDEQGKTWYEYSYSDIMEYNTQRLIMGMERQRAAPSKPSNVCRNISMDIV